MPLTTTLAGGSALIKWLLRDEFTDTRAAGAVNGTPATPGPGGPRVAVDTDGDALSISGGLLRFANSNGVFGDPGIWYAAVARTAGRVLFIQANAPNAANNLTMGFDDNQSGAVTNTDGRIWFTLDFLKPHNMNYSVFVPVDAVDYKTAIILRSSGAYYLIKGGTAAYWTMLWVASTGNTATLYPGIAPSTTEPTSEVVSIPEELYLPTPLAYDTFTRANGALGSSEAAGPDGQTAPVNAWSNRVGTTQIATNKASASALVGGIAIATVDTAASADVIAQATLTRAGNEVGIILRYVDADNYVRAIHDGTNCKLIKRVATAETDVISAAVVIGAGAIVVVCEGTSFSLYLNNAQVGVTSVIADAALQSGTEQGLFSTNVGNTQDDLLVMPRGTGGEYSYLAKFFL